MSARDCPQCGMCCNDQAEFHPYVFCVLKQAGRDPWADFRSLTRTYFGVDLPVRPPLVRDLPVRLTAQPPSTADLPHAGGAVREPSTGQSIQPQFPSEKAPDHV